MPIGLEEYILKKALKDIIDKSLIDFINKAILNKDFNNLVYRLNKALYSLKQASRQ